MPRKDQANAPGTWRMPPRGGEIFFQAHFFTAVDAKMKRPVHRAIRHVTTQHKVFEMGPQPNQAGMMLLRSMYRQWV